MFAVTDDLYTGPDKSFFVENFSRDQLISSLIDLHRARDQYRSVAQRGAVLWDCTRHMHCVNSMYAASFKQFVRLFEVAVTHADRFVLLAYFYVVIL
jgi:hypothetical protein